MSRAQISNKTVVGVGHLLASTSEPGSSLRSARETGRRDAGGVADDALDAGVEDDAAMQTDAPVFRLEETAARPPDDDGESDGTNILLVGMDKSAHPLGGRADAIALVCIDAPNAAIISVPRDLLVQVDNHPPKRINAIARLARLHRQDPKSAMTEVVEQLMDLRIEHTVFIEIEALEQAIDALGGVVVDVPCAIDDNFIVDRSPPTHELMRINAGIQAMSGHTAAMYIRSRHGRSDWDRQLRQHDVLRAVHRKVREQSPMSVLKAALAASEHIDTDMTHGDLLSLARLVTTIQPDQVRFVRFSKEMAKGTRLEDGRSVLKPDQDLIRQGVQAALAGEWKRKPTARRCKDRDVALH